MKIRARADKIELLKYSKVKMINTYSNPTDLKITDMRFVDIDGAPKRCTILKIMTNQGITGYGEVRDASSKTYALMLKSRILGENPCNVDRIFRKIKQFGGPSRQGGGVLFIPAHLVADVVEGAAKTHVKDDFGFEMICQGKFTTAQIDKNTWTEEMLDMLLDWIKNDPRGEEYRDLDWSKEYDLARNGDPNDTQTAL